MSSGETKLAIERALFASRPRIRQELGWTPRFEEIDLIVNTAWRWREAHPGGYRKATA